MNKLKWINVGLRGIMELGIIGGLGYWGFNAGNTPLLKILLGIGTPLIGFGFWGLVDFHNSGRFSEWLRLIQELIISGLAALLLYMSGKHFLGLTLAIVSIMHHLLIYLLGETLQK